MSGEDWYRLTDTHICEHEAAHAIAATAFGVPVTILSISGEGHARHSPYCETDDDNHPPLIRAIIGAAGPIWDEGNGLDGSDLTDWEHVSRDARLADVTIARVRRITMRVLRNHHSAIVRLGGTLLEAEHLTGPALASALADARRWSA